MVRTVLRQGRVLCQYCRIVISIGLVFHRQSTSGFVSKISAPVMV